MGDGYLKVASNNRWRVSAHTLGFRASYVDFFSQSQNDALSIRVSDAFAPDGSAWKFSGALMTNIYTSGSPGTTDESFTSYGMDFAAVREKSLAQATLLEFGGGSRLRFFPSFSGRTDFVFYGSAAIDHEFNGKLTMTGFTELGLLLSTLPDYSRTYLDIGGSADYALPARWNWTTELSIGQSFFMSRSVSTTTLVTERRGRMISGTRTENESYSSFNFSTEAIRKETESFKWGASLSSTNQTSKSGYQDFSAVDIMARLIWNLN